jgi:hypothetical protein
LGDTPVLHVLETDLSLSCSAAKSNPSRRA